MNELTAREQEVLVLLSRGLTDDEIGTKLSIKLMTVKTHTSAIYGKLSAQNRVEAVLFALRDEREQRDARIKSLEEQIANLKREFGALKFYASKIASMVEELGRPGLG